MNECIDYKNDPMAGKRRIVCAAIANEGIIVVGVRHHDSFINRQIRESGHWDRAKEIQGFVDQYGNFLNRKDAKVVAKAANQIIKTGGGYDDSCENLYSENLY